ncbi:MAG: M73 family metallopeptidase [Euryarchaeota archaeon]|nr:M73 family metallopeptidase [Euryarchaeota archaeon]
MKSALTAILTIAFVSSLLGAGTLAYFSDTETSSGNTLTAGTLDLKIKDGGLIWRDGIATAEWTLSNMKPGDSTYGSIDFKNFGNLYANHMEITANYTITDPPGPESDTQENTPADEMASEMVLTNMVYAYDSTEVDVLPLISDENGNGKKDLYDLKYGGADNLPLSQVGVQRSSIDMTVQLNPDAGNNFQGDTLNLTMIFTMNQHSSQ